LKAVVKYIDFNIQTELRADSDGYLDPLVRDCNIDIGKS